MSIIKLALLLCIACILLGCERTTQNNTSSLNAARIILETVVATHLKDPHPSDTKVAGCSRGTLIHFYAHPFGWSSG